MNNKQIIDVLNIYAEIADQIGDYKTADECYLLLKEANSINTNIKTAAIKTAFFKKLFRGIKNVGKAIDRGIRKMIPGGWMTVIAAVGAPYLAKLAPKLQGVGKQVLQAVKDGKNPLDLLKDKNPLVQQAVKTLIDTAKQSGQFSTPQQSYQQQTAMGMQTGADPFMSQYLGLQGYPQQANPQQGSYVAQPSLESLAFNNFNNTNNKLRSATPQSAQAIIQEYKNNINSIITQANQQSSVTPGMKQAPQVVLVIPKYNEILKSQYPQFANLI